MKYFWARTGMGWLILILLGVPAAVADTLSNDVNRAGRQRMLTQRIVKAYCQLAMQVQYESAREQLADSVTLFEQQLAELQQDSPDQEVSRALARVEQLWRPFKAVATGPVTKEGGKELLKSNEALLDATHRVVTLLEARAASPQAALVNISGRQRMLSQRIAKFYMCLSLGFKEPDVQEELLRTRGEFETALTKLHDSPENTAEIRAALAEVARQWVIFRKSFELRESGEYIPLLVALASESILIQMNEITGMYASLSVARLPDDIQTRQADLEMERQLEQLYRR